MKKVVITLLCSGILCLVMSMPVLAEEQASVDSSEVVLQGIKNSDNVTYSSSEEFQECLQDICVNIVENEEIDIECGDFGINEATTYQGTEEDKSETDSFAVEEQWLLVDIKDVESEDVDEPTVLTEYVDAEDTDTKDTDTEDDKIHVEEELRESDEENTAALTEDEELKGIDPVVEHSSDNIVEVILPMEEKSISKAGTSIKKADTGTSDQYTGVRADEEGVFHYYVDGEIDSTYTGIARDTDDVWYCIKNGDVDFDFSGLAKRPEDGIWYYIKDGILDWGYTGIAENPLNTNWYRVKNGQVDFSFNGLAKRPEDGIWYFLKNGMLRWGYTGIAENPINENWYRVKEGQVDFSFNGLAKRPEDGIWYYLKNGMLRWGYTGIAENPLNTNWYRVKEGQVDFGFTGLAKRPEDGIWYYLKNGMLRWGYTGIAENPINENWYRVKEGRVDFGFTGLAKRPEDGIWYFLKGGMLRWGYTGIAENPLNTNWYRVKEGQVDFGFTGLAKRPEDGIWYYLRNGMLRWGYTGIAENPLNTNWYRVKNGQVDFSFTGVTERPEDGIWYYLRNGMLRWGYTGIAQNPEDKGWYRVEKGMVNWDYTGGAQRPENGNWYYIRDGKLDWSYTGLDTAKDNKVYFYQNGVRKNKESIEWNGETYYFDTKTAVMLYSVKQINEGLLYAASISNGKTIALDPGHSYVLPAGVEPLGPGSGAMKEKDTYGTLGWATGLKEADLNLAVATKLRSELLKRGYSVILTRENNETAVSCVDRTNVANTIGADAYIRLHGNGDTSCRSGALTMCITQANTWQSVHYADCSRLSENVLDEYCKETGLAKIGVWYVDTLTGNNWAQVPTTLIEMGNMCNGNDDRWMADETNQFTMAEGIANGIDVFFNFS